MPTKYYLNTINDEGEPTLIEVSEQEAHPSNQNTPKKHATFVNKIRKRAGYTKNMKLKNPTPKKGEKWELEFTGDANKET
jgi:hypothetical protein